MFHNVTDNTIEDNNSPAYAISADVLGYKILPLCAPREEAMFQMASKHVYSIFNQATNQVCIWKFRLQHHFGITDRVLNTFESLRQHHGVTFSYRKMYIGLVRLHASRARMKKEYLFHAVTDKSQQFLVLAICADAVSLLPWIGAGDGLKIYKELCFYTGWHEIIKHLCRIDVFEYHYLLADIAEIGDVDLLVSLLEFADVDGVKINRPADPADLLNKAIASQNVAMVRKLFKRKNCQQFFNSITVHQLMLATLTNNVEMLKFFCELKDTEGKGLVLPGLEILNEAARLGNLPMVKFLVTSKKITPTYDTLAKVMQSGNVQLVQWLMTYKNKETDNDLEYFVICLIKHVLRERNSLLNSAVSSGSSEMVRSVLLTELGALLAPTEDTLIAALKTGNPEIVREIRLLANKLNIKLQPNQNTVKHAIVSGKIEIMDTEIALFEEVIGNQLHLSSDTLQAAFQSGNIEIVRALLTKEIIRTQTSTVNEISEEQLANVMCQHSLNAIQRCVNSNNPEMLAFYLKLKSLAPFNDQSLDDDIKDIVIAVDSISTFNTVKMRRILSKSALVMGLIEKNIPYAQSIRNKILLTGDLELVLELITCKNEKGEPIMDLDYNTQNGSYFMGRGHPHLHSIVCSELAYRDGIRFIKDNKKNEGESSLLKSYQHSPRNFLNSLRKTLETEPNNYAGCVFARILADENNRVDNILDDSRKLSLSNRILLEEMGEWYQREIKVPRPT